MYCNTKQQDLFILATNTLFEGSKCSMVTKELVRRLNFVSLQKTLIVQSFIHTEAIDTEYLVLEFLRTDGSVAQVRAYVVDRITNMTKVNVPNGIMEEFKYTIPWPESTFSGEVEISKDGKS